MNLQWILLAIFLVYMVKEVFKAITRPMHRNVLNLISIPVAFLITFIMQAMGLFQSLAGMLVEKFNLTAYIGAEGSEFSAALLSTLVSPFLFLLVYWLVHLLIKLVHVNLISKFIENKQIRKEKRLLKLAIKEEKELVKDIVASNEEEIMAIREALVENGFDPDLIEEYEFLDEDDIEDMVEKRVRREKRARKRQGFFKESSEKKAVSIITAAVSGFLALAIALMPMFHTMSVLSDMTDAIDKNDPDNNYNKLYLAIDFVDDNLVIPYESSFVYQIYDSMGLVDLMNETVRIGGKMTVNGKEAYADDVVRSLLANIVMVTTQIASNKTNPELLREGLNGILQEPIIFSMIYDAFVKIMNEQEVPEGYDQNDILSTIKYEIIKNYKQPVEPLRENFATDAEYDEAYLQYQKDCIAYPEMVSHDITALTDVIVTLVEKELIKDLITGADDLASILDDKDNMKDLLGAMSGLSVYDVVISGAFTSGINMIGPMLGIPANEEEGVAAFRNQIVNASNSVTDMTAEDIANLKQLFVGASDPANSNHTKNTAQGIFAYIANPLYYADDIKDELSALNDEFKEYEALANELSALQEKVNNGTITAEETARFDELKDRQDELFGSEGLDSFQEKADQMNVKVEESSEKLKDYFEQFQDRIKGFTPFITYFLNWNSAQKPFMLSGADTSSAPVTLIVDGNYYVANTDEFDIERLLDFVADANFGEIDVNLPNGGENVDDLLAIEVDDFLNQIPMREILEELEISAKADGDGIDLSPLSELIVFLVEKYSDSTTLDMTEETLNSVLTQFTVINTVDSSRSETLANELIDGTYEYTGVTVEMMQSAMHFGDDWTDDHKKNDSEKLVDIIFVIVDLMGAQGGDSTEIEQLPEEMSNETEGGTTPDGEGTGTEGDTTPGDEDSSTEGSSGEMDEMFEMLGILGQTFDMMADTYCLKDLPKLMLEGLLKNEMLSTVMTPGLLNEYMDKMEAEDFSYETFMNELIEKVTRLLDKINSEEVLNQ